MDIKPENIFLTHDPMSDTDTEDELEDEEGLLEDSESGEDSEELEERQRLRSHLKFNFKIGDLGLVTPALNRKEVYEGDARYLAQELLNEAIEKDLTRADVFALGMTMFEVMSGTPLPKYGDEWHLIREGQVRLDSKRFCPKLCALVESMIDREPSSRPTAAQVVQQLVKTKAQLRRELNSSKSQIVELMRERELRSSPSGKEVAATGSASCSPCGASPA